MLKSINPKPLFGFGRCFPVIARFESNITSTAASTTTATGTPPPSASNSNTKHARLPQPAAFNSRRHEGGRSDREKTTTYGWLMLSVPLATFGLGCWQVQRKQWKEQLVHDLEVQTNKAAVPFPKE